MRSSFASGSCLWLDVDELNQMVGKIGVKNCRFLLALKNYLQVTKFPIEIDFSNTL